MKGPLIALIALASFAFTGTIALAAGMPPPTQDVFGGPSPSDEEGAGDGADAAADTDAGRAEDKASGAKEEAQEGADSDIPIDLNDLSRVEAGKERFHSTCADFCHGHKPALFIGRPIEPHHAFQTIFDGGKGATPMPPWGEVFNEEEIWELVAYLAHLGKQPPE